MSEITVTYGDFVIFYWEHDNTWVPKRSSGSLPGRASLALAKASIDALGKQEKATFTRHKAIYMANDYSDPIQVEVTSFVAKDGKLFAWIKLSDGQRRCENIATLRGFTAGNMEYLGKIEAIKNEYNVLREQSQSLRKTLSHYVFPKQLYSGNAVPTEIAALLPK